jgi:hypothetical protein
MTPILLVEWNSASAYSYYISQNVQQTFPFPVGYDTISGVILPLKRISGSGNITVSIVATSGGVPTGTVLGSVTIDVSGIGTGTDWHTFTFASPITVSGGVQYAVQIYTSAQIAWWRSTNPDYGNGQGFVNGSDVGRDFGFKIYGYDAVTVPTVSTGATSSIAETTLTQAGTVSADGGGTITSRGVVYSKVNALPTLADGVSSTSGTTGAFSVNLSGLLGGSLYYMRAYATNSAGTSYGDVVTATTLTAVADVTTSGTSEIAVTTAKGSGNVTNDHGASVTERGICLGTASNPTISGTKFIASTAGVGAYDVALSGLSSGTLYHIRAYAINSQGTSYGSDASFTTANLRTKYAQQFTATKTGILSQIALYLKLVYGTSGTPTFKIYSDSANAPDAVLQTVTPTPITNPTYDWKVAQTNVAIVSGTKYWVSLDTPYVPGNYEVNWGYNVTGTGILKYQTSVSAVWTGITANAAMKVYQQPSVLITANLIAEYKKKYL